MMRPLDSDENDNERSNGLPQIPGATLSGMTTVIRGAHGSTTPPHGGEFVVIGSPAGEIPIEAAHNV